MGSRRKKPNRVSPPPVSLGGAVEEDLLLPVVHYPNHYGTFFAFAQDGLSPPVLCACTRSAVENYIRLKSMGMHARYSDPLREAPLDSLFFPNIIAKLSLEHRQVPLSVLTFEKRLCHRCNLVSPTRRYCHEMYGSRFIQYYGWYVNQAYLRYGILPRRIDFLPDVCPKELQEAIQGVKLADEEYTAEEQRLQAKAHSPAHRDIGDDEITYWANVRMEEAQTMIELRRKSARVRRAFTKKIENIVRQEFGFRKVGEGWISETMLFHIVSRIFPKDEVVRHHRPNWLEGLELDIYLPSLRLAFEYQGQQHFHPVRAWGGQKALEALQVRDERKAEICKQLGVTLITLDYTEPLTEEHVRSVLSNQAERSLSF